jgi:hypothetical protein
LRTSFDKIKDKRAKNIQYTLSDVLMSGFAMFSLKHESLLSFDTQNEVSQENLQKVYELSSVSSDSGMRKTLDKLSWKSLR